MLQTTYTALTPQSLLLSLPLLGVKEISCKSSQSVRMIYQVRIQKQLPCVAHAHPGCHDARHLHHGRPPSAPQLPLSPPSIARTRFRPPSTSPACTTSAARMTPAVWRLLWTTPAGATETDRFRERGSEAPVAVLYSNQNAYTELCLNFRLNTDFMNIGFISLNLSFISEQTILLVTYVLLQVNQKL